MTQLDKDDNIAPNLQSKLCNHSSMLGNNQPCRGHGLTDHAGTHSALRRLYGGQRRGQWEEVHQVPEECGKVQRARLANLL